MPVVYTFVVSWAIDETSLTTDLRGNFVVWKAGSGEDRNFLATSCILRALLALSFSSPVIASWRFSRAHLPTEFMVSIALIPVEIISEG